MGVLFMSCSGLLDWGTADSEIDTHLFDLMRKRVLLCPICGKLVKKGRLLLTSAVNDTDCLISEAGSMVIITSPEEGEKGRERDECSVQISLS